MHDLQFNLESALVTRIKTVKLGDELRVFLNQVVDKSRYR